MFRLNLIAAVIVCSQSAPQSVTVVPGAVAQAMMMRMKPCLALVCLSLALLCARVHAAELTLQQAVAKVEHEARGKVLSAEIKHSGKHTLYRIKVLTRDGQVRVIEVPADDSRQ